MRISSAGFLAAIALGGCVSSSIRSDLDRVRDLSRTALVPPDAAFEPGVDVDVHAILAEPLDPEGAVKIALLNNRELRAELHRLGISRGELLQASVLPNPLLELEALPERDTKLELRVEYDLTSLILAPLRARAAEADLDAHRHLVAAKVLELGHDVRLAFFRLQASEQRLATARRSLDTLAASRDAAIALFEAGNIKPVEASRQIAEYERARVVAAEIELEASERKEQLQRQLGLFGELTAWRSRGPLAPAPESLTLPEHLETRAIEASLELRETRARLLAIAHRTGLANAAGWLPDVAVDVHSLYGSPEDAIPEQDLWRFGAGVSLSLPVFDRGQGTRRVHEAEFDALAERHQGVAIELRSEVRDARNRLVSAHARARQFAGFIVPALRQVTERTLELYNAMQVGVIELLEARRDELDVELAYAETLGEYWRAAATLDALLAGARPAAPESGRIRAAPAAAGSRREH